MTIHINIKFVKLEIVRGISEQYIKKKGMNIGLKLDNQLRLISIVCVVVESVYAKDIAKC